MASEPKPGYVWMKTVCVDVVDEENLAFLEQVSTEGQA